MQLGGMLLSFFLVIQCLSFSLGCKRVLFSSNSVGSIELLQLPLDQKDEYGTGRPTYESSSNISKLYLYHMTDIQSGIGRWILSHQLNSDSQALQFLDSYAILPHLSQFAADKSDWMTSDTSSRDKDNSIASAEWQPDTSVSITCTDSDTEIDAFYFESSSAYQLELSGFYVRRYLSTSSDDHHPIYAHVHYTTWGPPVYFFKVQEIGTWLIGEEIGVDSGRAFLRDNASTVAEIDRQNNRWNYLPSNPNGQEEGWKEDDGYILLANFDGSGGNIYDALRGERALKQPQQSETSIPIPPTLQLRNGLLMPSLGLGTGGLDPDRLHDTITASLRLGYRLFDLAREYRNEYVFRDIFIDYTDDLVSNRRDLFLESKVWPTELGFDPTSRAVEASLFEIETNYVDLYLLHWPSCDPAVEWMHCEDTVDPSATWRESWRALERAYAEGKVMSIGVSNFDIALLTELEEMAIVLPHVVQNWAEPGSMDLEVRRWCQSRNVIYQPYASGRNLNQLSKRSLIPLMRDHAARRGVSTYAYALKFLLQTGAAMIPRSNSLDHLRQNIILASPTATPWTLTSQEMEMLGWVDMNEDTHQDL